MKGQLAFEALGALPDELIVEAAEQLGFFGGNTPAVASRRREKSALSRFLGSGWGVALICAVVSLTVLGGIIRAGQRPPAGGPGGVETETADYAGDSQTDVKVRHGDTEIYPQRFFLWATDWTWSGYIAVDGEGFEGIAANDYGNQPSLPKLRYATDGSISPCELTMSKKYEFSSVRVYDTDMQHATAYNYDGEFVYGDFLKSLATGRYYVVMEIRSRSAGYEYAFALEVFDPQEDTATEETAEPLISMERAKEIASDYWGIKTGDVSVDHGFEFRIGCRQTVVTPRGEEVYLVLLQWQVMPLGHWSTVDTVWVEATTGEIIIPYEDLGTETETEAHVHEYSEGEVIKISTCSEKGEMKRICLTCGDVKIEELPTAPHTEVIDPAVPPTIIETGLSEGKHCEVCGKVLVKQTTVAATGHTDLAYEVNEDGRTCTITGMGTCTATEIYIPSKIEGYKVTRIGEIAFISKPITAVHIPSSVTEIYDGAFYGCTELTEITLPSTITTLGYQVFQGCTGLTTATIQCRLFELPRMTFDGCTSLTTVNLPSGMSSIGMAAFADCTSLKEITFPSSIQGIGVQAFAGCTALTDMVIPSKLSILDDEAFVGCVGLSGEMILPDGMVRIGEEVFGGCSGITSITVPEGVKQAEPNAFERMGGLTDLYFRGTEAQWNTAGYTLPEGVEVHFGA